jgi:hypothetical protein
VTGWRGCARTSYQHNTIFFSLDQHNTISTFTMFFAATRIKHPICNSSQIHASRFRTWMRIHRPNYILQPLPHQVVAGRLNGLALPYIIR